MSNRFDVVTDTIDFNAWETVESVQVPIYFFAGKYDYTCNVDLQKEYYDYITAPVKNLYVFENSAHSPIFEEPSMAAEIFSTIVN